MSKSAFAHLLRCLALAIFLVSAIPFAHADKSVRIDTIETVDQADEFARELIASDSVKGMVGKSERTLMLFHVGDDVPEQLKWVMVHLDKAGVKTEIQLITKAEMEQMLDREKDESLEKISLLKYASTDDDASRDLLAERSKEETKTLWEKSKLSLRRIFGMPNGFTFWVKMDRTAQMKLLEAKTATAQAAFAAVSIGVSLYTKHLSGAELSITYPVIAMSAWIWANIFYSRQISEWMGQGRSVKETAPNVFKVVKSPLFLRLTLFARSVLSNVITLVTAYAPYDLSKGVHEAFSLNSFSNSFFTLFSRFWIEEWMANRQARTLKDGTVVVEAGRHSPETTAKIRFWLEFANGLMKNANLVGIPYVKWVFPAIGAIGVIKALYDFRVPVARKLLGVLNRFFGRPEQVCETLLAGRVQDAK